MIHRADNRGLYCPDDTLWHIHSESLLMLGGSRALLLELAHPLIAAGVAQHSNFRERPLRRLTNTVRVMVMLTFGSARMTLRAARHIQQCHGPVRGTLDHATGEMKVGTPYDANDPALRLWVFATLIDTTLLVHDRFIRLLSPAEKSAYYQDSVRMAQVLGVPRRIMPPSYPVFLDYFREMTEGGALAVGYDARAILHALFHHPLFGFAARVTSYVGIGLLPDRVCRGFGLKWTEADDRRLQALASLSRRVRARLPDFLCTFPLATYYRWRYPHGAW